VEKYGVNGVRKGKKEGEIGEGGEREENYRRGRENGDREGEKRGEKQKGGKKRWRGRVRGGGEWECIRGGKGSWKGGRGVGKRLEKTGNVMCGREVWGR